MPSHVNPFRESLFRQIPNRLDCGDEIVRNGHSLLDTELIFAAVWFVVFFGIIAAHLIWGQP